MRGKTDWDAAAEEAFEEAGVKGRVHLTSLGAFTYFKRQADSYELLDVVVYPLEVTGQMESFKERGQREAVWTSPIEAAGRVIEPGLKALVLHCEGRLAGKSAA